MFWLGIAAAFVSQSLNAALTKRSPLFVVGLISLGAITYKYLGDKRDAAQKLEYGDAVNLDVVGQIKSGAAGNYFVMAGGPLRAFIAPHVSADRDGRVTRGCTPSSLEDYRNAIKSFSKYPFAYFYLGGCEKLNGANEWRGNIDKAREILLIITQLPGHLPDHDEILNRIDASDFDPSNPHQR
jgi:hypothetical protein